MCPTFIEMMLCYGPKLVPTYSFASPVNKYAKAQGPEQCQ